MHSRAVEQRLAETQRSLAAVTAQNERLAQTLREARDQIMTLKEEVDRLAQPPAGFGTFLARNEDDSIDVFTGGRKLRVNVSPSVDLDDAAARPGGHAQRGAQRRRRARLRAGRRGRDAQGVPRRRRPGAGHRERRRGARRPPRRAAARRARCAPATRCCSTPGPATSTSGSRSPRSRSWSSKRSRTSTTATSAACSRQIEQIRDAVELPYLHPELFLEHELKPPEGRAALRPARLRQDADRQGGRELAGQEGRGRAPARRASRYFLNIKGPELLNKYVGETERHIRLVFQRAREKASEGTPVIVFFDEMDSLFRTRGSGVSSDVENTIVPQLLSEIDGVEGLENVLVIGASNREDMIDPAILRPGRLDVKIKIERPDAESARDIFSKYLTADLPLHADDLAEFGGDRRRLRGRDDPGHRRADVHRDRGEPLPRGDLRQRRQGGPVLQGLQLRRDDPEHRRPGQEDGDQGPPRQRPEGPAGHAPARRRASTSSRRTRTCPNTTNPDDWARISGKKGERIVFIRTLITGKQGTEPGRSIDTVSNTGQYL